MVGMNQIRLQSQVWYSSPLPALVLVNSIHSQSLYQQSYFSKIRLLNVVSSQSAPAQCGSAFRPEVRLAYDVDALEKNLATLKPGLVWQHQTWVQSHTLLHFYVFKDPFEQLKCGLKRPNQVLISLFSWHGRFFSIAWVWVRRYPRKRSPIRCLSLFPITHRLFLVRAAIAAGAIIPKCNQKFTDMLLERETRDGK